MQVHEVSYNLEFTKLKVTAAWSVQAEVTRGSEAKFRCDSISGNVFSQYVTNGLLRCILFLECNYFLPYFNMFYIM